MKISSKIAPCLWFDSQAEEAAKFYTGIFKNSKIVAVTRYGEAGQEIHGGKPGTVMTVAFELEGQSVHRAQRRPAVQVQRGHLAAGHLRNPGRDRPLLEQAHRRRRRQGAAVRLAEGQVRRLVAGRADAC